MIDNIYVREDRVKSKNSYKIYYIYLCKCCSKEIRIIKTRIPIFSGYCYICAPKFLLKKVRVDRVCVKCNLMLKKEDFHSSKGNICNNCVVVSKYNINYNDYLLMLQSQNNRCAICKQNETVLYNKKGKIKRLAVDHCHETGKIRGLLCTKCNIALGKFKDNTALLEKSINYLEQS